MIDFSGIDFKKMPPCRKVLLNKIKRTSYLARTMRQSSENFIGKPDGGWYLNENNEMDIDYFAGNPYPENITNISFDENEDNDEEKDSFMLSPSDDEISNSDDSDDEWDPRK